MTFQPPRVSLRAFAVFGLFFVVFSPLSARADVNFAPAEWALQAVFASEPKGDEQRTPSPQGDEIAVRQILEAGTDRMMLVRFVYPVVPASELRGELYRNSVQALMRSRYGVIRTDEPWDLAEHKGTRLVIEQPQEKTFREVRLIQIGASLYFVSAEWAGGKAPSGPAAKFLASIALQPAFADARLVEERERWREIVFGGFKLRYDATRWFRDPEAQEPLAVGLLRVDETAEAEFVYSPERNAAPTMEETVILEAKKSSESVKMLKRAKRMRGTATVEDLRYTVRTDGVTYENRGYFYSGSEGTIHLRAWSPDRTYGRAEGDITELLDGLTITRGAPPLKAATP